MDDRRRASALVDEAYTALGEAIVDGRLQPGDRLRDVELAELMGISRTPVREALQKLERIGLVEVAANRYTRVASLSDRQRTDMREYAAHTIAGAMRVGLRRCTDDEIATAVDLVEQMRLARTSREYVSGVLRFYAHMVAGSRNVTFSVALQQTELVLRRNLDGWEPIADDTRETLFRHLRDQVGARDANGATWTFLALHGFD